ncbi:hypothetical protein F4802DRAFT_4622 [Xylaria palmicola]|nr:hypothetical protein F4802DRAFT_4622 [Xylaria palmicola]
MSDVPPETFNVLLFERKYIDYSCQEACGVFMVRSNKEENTKFKIWYSKEGHDEIKDHHENLPEFETSRDGGFVKGRPLKAVAAPVSTCTGQGRPDILYRVVHDGQPHYGQKARGFGKVTLEPWNFQGLVEKHVCWQSRHPSPFISTTNSPARLKAVIKTYRERGFTGIRVIEFRTWGAGWDHNFHRLFYVPDFSTYFGDAGYETLPYLEDEYLLQYEIPEESIVSIRNLDDIHYGMAPRKRKRVAEETEPEEKIRVSSKRSKGFRREP